VSSANGADGASAPDGPTDEISGDGTLTKRLKWIYLVRNLRRNLAGGRHSLSAGQRFCANRLPGTSPLSSPSRALTEAFLTTVLPALTPPRPIRVLEIGCGSGRLRDLLSRAGYSGVYVGVDIEDRFTQRESPFTATFVRSDIHAFETRDRFDLVISVSALEHIRDDRTLVRRLDAFLVPGGLQVHFVPSGWGLFAYLWHGYRQYSLGSLMDRFDPARVRVTALGGLPSLLLHVAFITVGETLLPLRLRERLRVLYGRSLDLCLTMDRALPLCATMYAVAQGATAEARSERC
jgi:SAM-dependent methyltransferase